MSLRDASKEDAPDDKTEVMSAGQLPEEPNQEAKSNDDPTDRGGLDEGCIGACGGSWEGGRDVRPLATDDPSRNNTLSDSYHCEISEEVTTESEMCTEESIEKMTSSTEGMVSLSEDSSGRDTYAQAATAVYAWPAAAAATHSDTIDLDDSDDQMNGLMGSYREISMDEDEDGEGTHDGTRDEDMHADTEEEVSNLSNDSNEAANCVADVDEALRPNSLALPQPLGTSGSSASSSAMVEEGDVSSDAPNVEASLAELPGTVIKEGDLVLFVADDLHEKIKMASPMAKRGETPPYPGSRSSTPSLYKQTLTPQLPPIDPAILTDMEVQAQKVAANLDTMLENLTGTLHSMSSLTVDCMDTYRDSVCKTCDAMDANIKSMYQLMAKCEELGNTMRPMYRLADQIKEIKRLLDLFEPLVNNSTTTS